MIIKVPASVILQARQESRFVSEGGRPRYLMTSLKKLLRSSETSHEI